MSPPMTLQTIIRPLVDHAHQLLWIKVALENVFPGPSTDIQDSFTWDCIKEAAKDLGTFLKPILDMVSRYEVLKSRAIAYVWSGASQLRGELVKKARDIADWSPEVLAAYSLQSNSPSSSMENPWAIDAGDIQQTIDVQPKPHNQICWLKNHESQCHGYHTLFNVLARFQGGRFLKHPVYSDCPDSFCSPNGITSPGHISAWCTAKTADPILQNDQECFIMDGQY
ncbi:hypothetical protein BD769DRAFT_1670944 [Suillus cothurnatus]|nr:hypothetical protein BD769DRAFT_1670944 [Suillus cothurnatus]